MIPINVAFIGCGHHMFNFLYPRLRKLPVLTAGICDKDPAKLDRFSSYIGMLHFHWTCHKYPGIFQFKQVGTFPHFSMSPIGYTGWAPVVPIEEIYRGIEEDASQFVFGTSDNKVPEIIVAKDLWIAEILSEPRGRTGNNGIMFIFCEIDSVGTESNALSLLG